MCIRDRPWLLEATDGQLSGRLPDLRRIGCAGAGRADRCQDCLLYTSDAADDLLCVDLGGRRIIKKKKKSSDSGSDEREQ